MMGASYKTKKELKESIGEQPLFIETSAFGPEFKGDGHYTVVGPDPFTKRSWYATVVIKNGRIVQVK